MVCILLLDYFSFHVLTAVQHTGIGFDQISGILAELNMPPISRTVLSRRQEEIGKATECVASLSMQEALDEEVLATNM